MDYKNKEIRLYKTVRSSNDFGDRLIKNLQKNKVNLVFNQIHQRNSSQENNNLIINDRPKFKRNSDIQHKSNMLTEEKSDMSALVKQDDNNANANHLMKPMFSNAQNKRDLEVIYSKISTSSNELHHKFPKEITNTKIISSIITEQVTAELNKEIYTKMTDPGSEGTMNRNESPLFIVNSRLLLKKIFPWFYFQMPYKINLV